MAFDFQHMSNMKKDLEYTLNVGSVSVEMQDRDDRSRIMSISMVRLLAD